MGIENIGDNVRRQMKIKGLSIAKLSAQVEIGTATLSNILNGKSEPKSTTLIKLADAFDVNINDLIEDAPQLETLRFRTNKTLSAREKAERDQIRFDTAIWLKNYHYLEEILNDVNSRELVKYSRKNPKKAAQEARKFFGVADEKQPIYDIADLVEEKGIKLKIHNFGFKKTNGLSVGSQDEGPAIVVNSESGISIERQIFTIAHELGHLFLHLDSYNQDVDIEDDPDAEKEADLFAGNFLLPEKGLLKEWEEANGLHWVDAVLKIKKIYKVSYRVVLVRLCQINDLSIGDISRRFAIAYNRLYKHDLKNHYEPDKIKKEPFASGKNDLIEDRYALLVKKAYENEVISLSRAGEMLDLSINDMRERAKAWQENPINV